jgi:hypothetical protein
MYAMGKLDGQGKLLEVLGRQDLRKLPSIAPPSGGVYVLSGFIQCE